MEDEKYMRVALKLAAEAASNGEIPVGAVIVKDSEIIGMGYNRREKELDISSHAEIEAMKEAEKKLGNWRLDGCTMYVTLEPCLMCSGAILQSRLSRLVYAAKDPRDGAITSHYFVFDDPSIHNRPLTNSGILSSEAESILSDFFSAKRKK